MIDAIKAKPKVKPKHKSVTQDSFEFLIKEVYDVMLNYTRVRGKPLTKDHPILIGNVTFWFNVDEDGTQLLSFEPSVPVWRESSIVTDIQRHTHDLYYNETKK